MPVSEARNALDKAKVIAHYTYNRRHKRNYNQGFVNQNARRNVAENQIPYNSAAEAGQERKYKCAYDVCTLMYSVNRSGNGERYCTDRLNYN